MRGMQDTLERLGREWKPALATLVCLAIPSYVFLVLSDGMTHGGIGYDENFFLWGGWCITKGLRPYADFIEFKPPFTFLTHALALKLFGFDGFRYRLFFVYLHLLALGAAELSLLSRGADKVLSTLFLIGYVALFANTRFHDTALTDTESIGLAYYLLG